MRIQCDCGSFQADLTGFPRNSPGRLACYCNDCQAYLEKLGRKDLLDAYGGTEVIPVYPSEFVIASGKEHLRCNRLSRKGLNRWSATCCNSPIANTKANFPWVGILHNAYRAADPQALDRLGPVRSRIMGKYAKGKPPFEIAERINFKAMMSVLPFLLKGKLFGKSKPNPFFKEDGTTPISEPKLL